MNRLVPALLLTFALAACASDDGSSGTLRVALRVEAPPPAFADGCGNTLSSAQIVLREIELDRVSDEDEPEDVETGPYLIDLVAGDFNGMIQQGFLEATMSPGEYDQVEFDLHKLDDGDPKDAAAAEADPSGLGEMLAADLSVRFAGTGSSGAFAFESSIDAQQEHAVSVVIGDAVSGIDNITLTVDPAAWFLDELGACLDAADAGNQESIEEAIKQSFSIDEDDDEDGIADEDDPDDGDDIDDE